MIGNVGRYDLDLHQLAWVAPDTVARARPYTSPAGVVVCFDGRLDNRGELGQIIGTEVRAPFGSLSDAECVAAVYARTGERFASLLNGDFALALIDPGKRHLILARDVMGARRLHYTQVGRILLFASDISSLLAQPGVGSAPDEDALADLVLDRWLDGHRTGFRGIWSVPPGQQLVATLDAIALRPHWMFDPGREVRCRTFDEYADRFRGLFEQAVARRMRASAPVAVSVSGGVDSSSIYCQAAAVRKRDQAAPDVLGLSLTFPEGSPADERQFLDVLDAWRGERQIIRLPHAPSGLLAGAATLIAGTEMPTLFWDPHPAVFEEARRRGCSVVLDGYFGDQVLFTRDYLIDLARRGRVMTIRRHLREFGIWMTDLNEDEVKREFLGALARSMAPRWLFHAVKGAAIRQRSARYPAWYTKPFVGRLLERQMTRFPSIPRVSSQHTREGYLNATAGHYAFHADRQGSVARTYGLDIAYPFRDRDLVAFQMAVPGDVVSPDGIPKGLLRTALSTTLPPPIRDRRWKADFTNFSNRAVTEDFAAITRLLTRNALSVQGGFVDGGIIEQSLSNFAARVSQSQSAEAGWRLSDVVGLELWLRHFFGDGIPDDIDVGTSGTVSVCTTS